MHRNNAQEKLSSITPDNSARVFDVYSAALKGQATLSIFGLSLLFPLFVDNIIYMSILTQEIAR